MHTTQATVRKVFPDKGIAFVRPDGGADGVDAILHLTKAPDVSVGDRLAVLLRSRSKGLAVKRVVESPVVGAVPVGACA